MSDVIKKILSVMIMIFLCASCGSQSRGASLNRWMRDEGKVKILSTIAQIGDLVVQIGGERVDPWVLIPGELDPHSYELVKGDGEKIERADIVFYNGLGLEHGASLFAKLQSTPNALAVGDEVRSLRPEVILQKGGVVDPHLWMDISIWQEAADVVAKKLSEVDPDGAELYRENLERLKARMADVHVSMVQLVQAVPSDRRFLVTSHDAFRYFVKAYMADPNEIGWEDRFTAPEGLAPDGQLSPSDIRRAIEFLKNRSIQVVFPESNVSRDAVAKIASASSELGFKVSLSKEPLFGDSMGGMSYLEMMRRNAEVIARELTP